MMAKRYGNKHHSSNKTFNPRRERRQASTAPQFEVTGIHVVTFVVALLTAAYFAGLLPDP